MPLKNLTISTTGDVNYFVGPLATDSTNQWNLKLYRQLFGATVNVLPPQKQAQNVGCISVRRNMLSQGTSGTRIEENFFDVIALNNVTEAAREFLNSVQNKDQVARANEMLSIIQSEVIKLQPPMTLPPISAFQDENGALLLEWIFNDFRVGFNLEMDENESGWYLASKPSSGGIVASGLLTGIDQRGLVAWLIYFAISKFHT